MTTDEWVASAVEIAEKWKLPQIWWALEPAGNNLALRGFSLDGRVWAVFYTCDEDGVREVKVQVVGRWEEA